MTTLKESINGYVKHTYKTVRRNERSYKETDEITISELARLVEMYKECTEENQTARLIRDSIDHWIRRYHDYSIRGSIGAHYRQAGIKQGETVFEHVIPARDIRDMLIQGVLSPRQALNAPTCLISKSNDEVLLKSGLSSSTPSRWHFWDRYRVLNDQFSTYNGTAISDPHNWTLEDHYKFFGIM